MKIAIIGTGYVGLPTGAGLAELGNQVVCIDKDEAKIAALEAGRPTLYEDGLAPLLEKNLAAGRLQFTADMKAGVDGAEVVMIAVGTPPDPRTGEADLRYIYAAAEELAQCLDSQNYTVVATKSTVPVGTGDEIERIIKTANPDASVDVVSLPEFLREGFAIADFFAPDRIVVGADSPRAAQTIEKLYQPFKGKTEFLFTARRSSETIKYASNAFLAMKIHYIDEMADFCEAAGADVREVARGMGLDSRIGRKFLNPGPGYGGSCFPKDTSAMAAMGRKFGAPLSLVETTIAENAERKTKMAARILKHLSDKSQKIAVLGLAFKNGTDDCRESPAVQIVQALLEQGASNIAAYDPQAMDNAKILLGDKITMAASPEAAAEGAQVLAILTEWPEFSAALDWQKIADVMQSPRVVDLRNLLDPAQMRDLGFAYEGIGKK